MPNQNLKADMANLYIVTTTKNYAPTYSQSVSTRGLSWSASQLFSGIENPSWRHQILRRLDATTPYTAAEFSQVGRELLSAAVGSTAWPNGPGRWDFVQVDGDRCANFILAPQTSDLASCDNLARTEFFRQMQASFSAGTFFGELRETARMIRQPALALRKQVSSHLKTASLRRTRLVTGRGAKGKTPRQLQKEWTRVAAETWLEYRFGMLPLALDIQGAYEVLCDRLRDGSQTQNFHVRQEITRQEGRSRVAQDTPGLVFIDYYRRSHTTTQVAYWGAVYTQVNSDVPFGESFGILPEQFLPVAWELAPYSWLADYFTNVGDVLNAWATAIRLRYVYCGCTRRVKTQSIVDAIPYVTQAPYHPVRLEPGYAAAVAKSVSRVALSGVPLPSFQINAKLSTSRGVNIASVAHLKGEDVRFRNRYRL